MKLFKTLRQDFIKQGNLKRYLLYAVGEILLVMIGISLAFQVSNWDDNRIKKNAEIRFYENIKEQIIDDKELIAGQRHYNNRHMVQYKYANEIIEANDRSKLDTLGIIVRNLTNYSDFDKEGNIYETMVNSGQIKLLQNHEIVNGIRELEELYNYMNRMENIHYDAMMQHLVVALNPVIAFATNEIKKPDAVFTYEFQNLVVMLMQIMEEKDEVYTNTLYEIERVLKLIDEELK
ncbi:MAG: DUF6090 family protein [Eudoraea sp.]|jgi:hypothetical protein|uniref:DUF6090 family protein n=1 Tax=Eudoraea sp. TaxID=1979955 RepID=UPI003C7462BE